MPSKTPNGNEPVENGIRGNQDIEMKDDSSSLKGKAKKPTKDGDEEMTVVVPPSKTSKQSPTGPPPGDVDMDVAMDDAADKTDDAEVKIDPVSQTVSGRYPGAGRPPSRARRHLGVMRSIAPRRPPRVGC